MRASAPVGVLALLLGTAAVASPASLAAYTDGAGLRSSSVTGATLAAPTGVACANGPALLGYVDVSWTPISSGGSHRVEVESTPGTWLVLGTTSPGTGTFRITYAMVGSILSLGVTCRVRLTAIAGSRWASAPSTTTAIRTLSVLGIGLVVACA